MVLHQILAAVATPPSTGITAKDYLIAAGFTAGASAIPALLAWHSARKGRAESHADVGLQNLSLANKFEGMDLQFQRMDLRFDKVEDTMDKHLDWHRVEAERHLPDMLKESNVQSHTNPGT